MDQTRFGVELPAGAEPVKRYDGVATMMLIDCPGGDRYLRVGLWFGPAADSDGMAASPAALRAFFGPFQLCAR